MVSFSYGERLNKNIIIYRDREEKNYKRSGRIGSTHSNFLCREGEKDGGEIVRNWVETLRWRPEFPLNWPGFPRGRRAHQGRPEYMPFGPGCNALHLFLGWRPRLEICGLGTDLRGPDWWKRWQFIQDKLQAHRSRESTIARAGRLELHWDY